MENFTKTELRLLAKVLKLASEEFGNHGCNDLVLKNTNENWELVRKIEKESCGNSDDAPDRPVEKEKIYTFDWVVMSYLAKKAKILAESV
jgi:hypothetical protein